MAVYTDLSDEALNNLLAEYDLGALHFCKGIAEGVENSNFLLQTERANFILTLYEKRVDPKDLPFFLGLLNHLAARNIPCPTPIPGRDGKVLREAAGRPAAIQSFLTGMSLRRPGPNHCRMLGRALAELHKAAADFPLRRPNALSIAGWKNLLDASAMGADKVMPGLGKMLAEEYTYLKTAWPRDLPEGIIHADLFPDNVFFTGDQLSGLIDFYFACNDFLAYDLSICLNAWCFEEDGAFNATKARGLLRGYQEVRPLTPAEVRALPLLARGSALRFLLTRLYDWLNQVPGALVKPKDPLEYWRKLRFHAGIPGPEAYGLETP